MGSVVPQAKIYDLLQSSGNKMTKFLALFALALSMIGGNAAAQSLATNAPAVARPATFYTSTTAMAANTPDTVFSPGANSKGAIVWSGFAHNSTASVYRFLYLYKTSAPTSVSDGKIISVPNVTSGYHSYIIPMPVFIPAGNGLYYINSDADGSVLRSVMYTLIP